MKTSSSGATRSVRPCQSWDLTVILVYMPRSKYMDCLWYGTGAPEQRPRMSARQVLEEIVE